MSKKEINFNKLEPMKKLKVKKPEKAIDTEKAIQSIHNPKPESEAVKRITLDLPASIYKTIKIKNLEEETTMRIYFIDLAKKDLNID